MANANRYYKTPFAESGNKAEVPNVSVGGAVGFDSGFGPDYELPQGSPSRKRIERDLYNGMHFGITKNLKQWQESLYPTWIEDDGTGSAFSYPEGMIVSHSGNNWISSEAANQEEPGAGTKWSVLNAITSRNIGGYAALEYSTVADLATGTPIGGVVGSAFLQDGQFGRIADRGGALWVGAAGGTSNGADILNAGTGFTAVLIIDDNRVLPKWFGAESSGSGVNITRLFQRCNLDGLTIVAGSLTINQTVNICSMDIGNLTITSGGFDVGTPAGDLDIKIKSLTGPSSASSYFQVFLPVNSSTKVKVTLGRAINAELTDASGVANLDSIFHITNSPDVDFTADYCANINKILRTEGVGRLSVNSGVAENYLTAYYIDCEDFYFNGPSGVNSSAFEGFVVDSGVPLNGRDMILGGGSVKNVVKNSNSTRAIERGFYLQIDGTDNVVSGLIEDKEIKVTGKVVGSNTMSVNINNCFVSHELTGTFTLSAYDANGATISDTGVIANSLVSPFEFYNVSFLEFKGVNIVAPLSVLLGTLSIPRTTGQTNITANSHMTLDYIINFANSYSSGDIICADSDFYLKGGSNFGLFINNALTSQTNVSVASSTIRCDILSTLNTANITLNMTNIEIDADDIASAFITSPNIGGAETMKNVDIKSSSLFGVQCNFSGRVRETLVGGNTLDSIFESMSISSIGGDIVLPLRKYICDGWDGSTYFKFSVVGATVTDIIGTHAGKLIPTPASQTLTVSSTIKVNIESLL